MHRASGIVRAVFASSTPLPTPAPRALPEPPHKLTVDGGGIFGGGMFGGGMFGGGMFGGGMFGGGMNGAADGGAGG